MQWRDRPDRRRCFPECSTHLQHALHLPPLATVLGTPATLTAFAYSNVGSSGGVLASIRAHHCLPSATYPRVNQKRCIAPQRRRSSCARASPWLHSSAERKLSCSSSKRRSESACPAPSSFWSASSASARK